MEYILKGNILLDKYFNKFKILYTYRKANFMLCLAWKRSNINVKYKNVKI